MDDINSFLSEQKRTNAECAAGWIEIESLFNDKLWPQLTEKIISFIGHPAIRNQDCLVKLYRNFILPFGTKIGPNRLVDIVSEVTTFMTDKKLAIEFLESTEDIVKNSNDAVWRCYVLKGEIHLNHLNDLDAAKRVIDTLRVSLETASDFPMHRRIFSLVNSYCQRIGYRNNDDYQKLEEKFNLTFVKFNSEIERLNNQNEKSSSLIEKLNKQNEQFSSEIERLNKENEKFKDQITSLREIFDEKVFSVKTEIEKKFTTEAVRNFEEVIRSQAEVSNLRKLNGQLLVECSQLKIIENSLEDDKTKLESKLETVIAEQQRQKDALMLMGAHLEKLRLNKNDDDKLEARNETGE